MPNRPENIVPITSDVRSAAERFSAEHDRELLTILFTDLVDSTRLQSDLGNVEAARLTELHRSIVRAELSRYKAREVEWAGDSCLAVFTKPSDAVVFALRMQAEHRRVRESEPKLSLVRVGMHLGEIVVKKRHDGGKKTEDLFGLQVSEAARVMSVARGDQVFCTRAVFDNARGALKGRAIEGVGDAVWVNYGAYLLKGSAEPVELCEIGSADVAVMKAPEANDKVAPVLPGGVEAMRALIPYEGDREVAKGLSRGVLLTIGLLLAVGGTLAGRFLLDFGPAQRGVSVGAPIRSLAVLPFENLMGDETKEYFVDGMTDTLTAELSKIASIKVIARTSAMKFKGSDKTLSEIARQLGVDGLIEGSVQQFGDEIRITAQLIHGASEEHLWGENFEGTLAGVMKLQGEVAVNIADQIGAVLTPEARDYASAKDVNPEAYDLYLQGRSIMQSRLENDIRIALNLFEKAIALDPEFALPHSGVADVYSVMRYLGYASGDEAKEPAFMHARKAIELDDSLAEAHASLGFAYALFDIDRNWAASERAFQRAIELNPGFVRARTWHGWLLTELGQTSEALSEMRVAVELDPLDPIALGALGRALRLLQRYEEAEEALLAANVMDPLLSFPFRELSHMYQSIGRIDDALQAAHKVYDITRSPDAEWNVMFLGVALKGPEALRSLVVEVERGEHDGFSPRSLVNLYLAVGDDTMALTYIQDYILSSYNGAMRVRGTERFHSLEADPRDRRYLDDDPRFWEMLDKYNLPPLPPEHPRYAKEQAYLRQKAAEAALAAQPKPVRRFILPASTNPLVEINYPLVSPSGNHIVYIQTEDNTSALYVRAVDGWESRVLPGTQGASNAFFSPDGNWIGFQSGAKLLKTRIDGKSAAQEIAQSMDDLPRACWGPDGRIYYAPNWNAGIVSIPADGGDATPVTRLEEEGMGHWFPNFLPDGQSLLFTQAMPGGTFNDHWVCVANIESGEIVKLFKGGSAYYLSSGHIVYLRADTYYARAFDPARREFGEELPVLEHALKEAPRGDYPRYWSASSNGLLAYVEGDLSNPRSSLAWVNRAGDVEERLPFQPDNFGRVSLSHDETRLAVDVQERGMRNLWVYDLERDVPLKIMTQGFDARWTGDDRRLVVTCVYETKGFAIYEALANGQGEPRMVFDAAGDQAPVAITRTDDTVVGWFNDSAIGDYLGALPLDGDAMPRVLVEGPDGNVSAAFSPRDDWIVYSQQQDGRSELYMARFPSMDNLIRVSKNGGDKPRWSTDGSELFFVSGNSILTVSTAIEGGAIQLGTAEPLFEWKGKFVGPDFDVSSDGRFLMKLAEEGALPKPEIRVVSNWFEELNGLAPISETK